MHAVVEQCVFRELNISSEKQIFSLIWRMERVQGLKHKPAAGKEQEEKAARFKLLASPRFVCAAVRRAFPFFYEDEADECLRDYKEFFGCVISRDHLRILDSSLESRDVGQSSMPASLFPHLSLPPPMPATLASCHCRTWHRLCQEQRSSEQSCPSTASPSVLLSSLSLSR